LGLGTGPDSEEYDSAQSVRIRVCVVTGQGHFTSVAQVTWRQFHSRVRLTVVIASAIERNIKLFGVVEQQFETHLLSPSEILSYDHQGLQYDPGSNALLEKGVIEPWVTQPRQLETQPHLERPCIRDHT
jgi:hypothetical protein